MKITKNDLITKAATIKDRITTYGQQMEKMDKELHILGCSVLNHAIQHGDVTLAQSMVESMGKTQRANAMKAWLCNFGPFQLKKVDKTAPEKLHYLKKDSDLTEALKTPFWEWLPEPKVHTFDIVKQLASLLKRANDRFNSEDAEVQKKNNMTKKQLDELTKFCGKMGVA